MNADSGRRELFSSLVRSRYAIWGALIGIAGVEAYGAWKDSTLIMAAGPPAVLVAVVALSFAMADRMAAHRFFTGYARSVGLSYSSSAPLPTLTPLLAAGQRRHLEHWMHGRLPGDLGGGVGHLVWERIERERDGNEVEQRVKERNRFTVCVVDLEPSMGLFRGVYLRPRRGVFAAHSDWLRRARGRNVEVESSEFTQRFELRLADDQDEIVLRRLLSPTLVSWLANHPLMPGFELKAGTLCVFVERPLEDAGNITFLVDATRHLAGRVLAEVEEDRLRAA